MKRRSFHLPKELATGVRLRLANQQGYTDSGFGIRNSVVKQGLPPHPFIRIISALVTGAFFLSSSPALFALSARQAMLGAGGGKGSAANLLNAGAASASLTAAQAQAVQKKTDNAVAAMKAFQNSAHAIMAPAGTPNGLAAGWLGAYNPTGVVNAKNVPVTWSGVSSLNQKGNTVTVTQGSQDAYLYWNNFSVGPQTTLDFNQSAGGNNAGTWIAFNRVMGNTKTEIYGSIKAQGQVYILNQNGILFHNGSQVNTHALVASTLPINDNLAGNPLNGITGRGIANDPDYQFLFSALALPAGTAGPTAAFTPPAAPAAGIGNVVVDAGASISSPANASHTGGLVALIGPDVYNNGSISTPNGQTILAAGLQVELTPHASSDPSLRGMDVAIGAVSAASVATLSSITGIAQNSGYISMPEGDATLAGKTVDQFGVIDSSTSVSLNGRIDLLANYNTTVNATRKTLGGPPLYYENTGVVDIGAGSVMRILPEWSSDATVTGAQLALNSVVSILGSSVEMGSGAVIDAPGAAATSGALAETGVSLGSGVTIQAGTWFNASTSVSQFAYTAGQITLDSGAEINVAGSTDIQVQSAQNFLTLQLRGAELANSSLERTSSVRGVSITLDARLTGTYNGQYWVGTPLGDVTGFAALIEKTVGELTTTGGSVALNSGASVILQSGSSINTSGGWIQYSGGDFSTTKLMYQGEIINIGNATPDRTYSGIYTGTDTETYAKWGVTKTFTSILNPTTPQYQAPYISGGSGGSITIQAPSTILNGSLIGNTVDGPRQLRSSVALSTLPVSSALTLDIYGQTLFQGGIVTVSPYAPTVTFARSSFSSASSINLSPDLVSSDGFANLTVLNHDGSIVVPADTMLNAGVNGSISLEGANITIDGSITAPGGAVSLTADLSPYSVLNGISGLGTRLAPILDVLLNQLTGDVVAQYGASSGGMTTVINPDGTTSTVANSDLKHYHAGIVTVASGATISTAGLLVNDMPGSSDRYQAAVINGGSITIAGYQVALQSGGVLNVSGGAILTPTGSISYGNAGTISLMGGQDTQNSDVHSGFLELGSTLNGYAGLGATAGTLALKAPAIQIGGNSAAADVVNLTPDFFDQGGFGTFNLTGVGREISGSSAFTPGIDIAPGTLIHPEVASSIISASEQGMTLATYTPAAPYQAVANISFTAAGLSDPNLTTTGKPILIPGNLVMGAGSSIILDPQIALSGSSSTARTGSVSFSGDTVAVMGSITVPGGSISISGAGTYPANTQNPASALITVDLAPSASLSTAGEALFITDPLGLRENFGNVLSGGSISVSGNILAEAGSVLDASGASGLYDLFSYQLQEVSSSLTARIVMRGGGFNGALTTPYQIDSRGGSISLKGAQELYSEATLMAQSGGPTAAGGSLSISSGRFYNNVTPLPTDLNLAVSQNTPAIPVGFHDSGMAAIGQAVPASGGIASGGGHISIDSFSGGGFDSVTLGGNVIFNGPIDLSVPGALKIATAGVISADSTVNLTASYVALGTPFLAPLQPGSTALTTVFGTSSEPNYLAPTFGTGQLNITAELIDIGNLSLQNIGSASLNASLGGAGGTIRGDGTFDIAGNLVLKAAEIYPATGVDFTVAAYNHDATTGGAVSSGGIAGSIRVERSGSMNLPLSAGGTLSLYASSIVQGGNLLAPFGTINLGNDGSGTQPLDPVSGLSAPSTQNLSLLSGSITSVSAVDPLTGLAFSIPYGTSADGTSWIDPSGTPITTTGLPEKSVNLSAKNLVTQSGSVVDLRGGGSVTANEWISGLGGTINLLGSASESWASTTSYSAGTLVSYKGSTWSSRQESRGVTPSVGLYWTQLPQYYAIIPGYQAAYAPTGYADGSLSIGSQVKLNGGGGLSAGTYTLLPASYATQPGAFLISANSSSGALAGSLTQPDGSVIVSGTRINGLDSAVSAPQTTSLFTLLSPSALAARVQYSVLSADKFFSALGGSSAPADAGKLVFQATTSMSLNGRVLGEGGAGGTGARIDISTPLAVEITQNGTGGNAGDLVLGASQLSSWSFGSLLIGGDRGAAVNGLTPVSVTSSSVTLDSGVALSGNDIILAASGAVTLDQGSSILASGNATAPDENLSISGDGALLRISSDQNATSTRTGTDSSSTADLSIASGVALSGASLTLDSSGDTSISPSAALNASRISLKAGKIAFNFDGSTEAGALNLGGTLLQSLDTAKALNLTSYSSMDFHGSGLLGSASLAFLGLHAGEILGDNSSIDSIEATTLLIDNASGSTDPSGGAPVATGGALTLTGSVLKVGSGALSIGGFQTTTANASGGIEGTTTAISSSGAKVAGTLAAGGNLILNTPLLTGSASSKTSIQAAGSLNVASSSGSGAVTPGLGASLTLKGTTVDIAAPIELPSGSVSIESTTGDLTVAGKIDVSGISKTYFNVTKYTSGGSIALSAESGNVNLVSGSRLDLNAPSAAGSAGSLSVSTPDGTVALNGTITAAAPKGTAGNFTADLGSYNGGNLSPLETALTTGGFTQSQNIEIRTGDVTVADVQARSYTLSADAGSITVSGEINASGENAAGTGTGGSIALQASGSVILASGSELTVHADTYDKAGKGGSIFLSAGAEINGQIDPNALLDLQSGSTIDLGVTAIATSIQDLGGVLHLRAPVVIDASGDATGLQVGNLSSVIDGASSIALEGYMLYDVTTDTANGGDMQISIPLIQGSVQGSQSVSAQITTDINDFYSQDSLGNPGAAIALSSQLAAELAAANPQNSQIAQIFNLAPGVEIINAASAVGLTLSSDWDLSQLRAGANSAPGFLTLRTPGNITFNASLSDGFQSSAYDADLLSQNTALPANFQSWAYRITAGSDLGAANLNTVVAGSSANVALGIAYAGGGPNVAPSTGTGADTGQSLSYNGINYYQVIRTGTGDISIAAPGDLQLWNQFASIYTAGVQVTDPTMGGTFDVPSPQFNNQNGNLLSALGAAQQATAYLPQFSYAGGNLAVSVGGDITQLAKDINGNPIADSVGELPSNWLYRRGSVNPVTGTFQQTSFPVNEVASTAWWVDFSNFFDDFGALGGGNISLDAGQNISNINASIPTNFRMPGRDANGNLIQAKSATGIELGGGSLLVNAGNNIDAGVYYVENGKGSLNAGGSIITNPTRDPGKPSVTGAIPDSSLSYLPTTLFLGKGSFDIQAAGDVRLGPVANVFLAPQGVNNSYWYKDYFSTYAASDQVNVESLGGNVTFREDAVLASGKSQSILASWMQEFTTPGISSQVSYYQPWLRLAEPTFNSSDGLSTLLSLAPPTLNASALSGDITFQGDYITSPSAEGNISLVAAGSLIGLTEAGTIYISPTSSDQVWISSRINLSDANPDAIPGINDPLSLRSTTPSSATSQNALISFNGHKQNFATGIASLFAETGSYAGAAAVLQAKEQLHDSILLHAGDSTPLQFYAQSGDISGLTLFSAKQADISAGGVITDIGLYIQNNSVSDVSIVSAGGDIVAYDPSSVLQNLAQSQNSGNLSIPLQSGDIQISGPGTLEVLAGGNVDLGNNPGSGDPTLNVGITSIGNSRNPALPFSGADIIVEAGLKLPTGLSSAGGLGLQNFANTVLSGSDGAIYLSELSDAMTYSGDPLSGAITAASFASGSTQLSSEEKAKLELQLFYIVLRDTGRNHNKVGSPGYGSYATGEQAIQTFFGSSTGSGNIITWSQRISTLNGGNIDLLAPGGSLTLASTATEATLTPPGIVTEGGGGINIYTRNDVSIGNGRIFTLRGGDIMIWSDKGNIAAGSSSKTVQSAPPTQVLIDPTSGNVETDLAGLATGGGIGVLETVVGVPPGNVDLIAPSGVIDAGDAGIRSSGNLNLAATQILNANNIAASGTTSGAPPAAAPPAAPNISGATAASSAAAANNSAAQNASTNSASSTVTDEAPSIISVEVLGYGGGDDDSSAAPSGPTTSTEAKAPPQASL